MSFKQGGRNKNSIVFFCCSKQEENYMQENKNEQTTGTKTPKLGQESGFQAYRLYNAKIVVHVGMSFEMFQSSFELTGYITIQNIH